MKGLLLRETPTQAWQALVQESALKADIQLNEALESYLVFLLMRFVKEPALAHTLLAIDYLQLQHLLHQARKVGLRDLGDKCLLLAGLYPGNASRKQVSVDYFIKLGRTAYADLSILTEHSLSQLYFDLSQEFVCLMEVLFASWESEHAKRLLPDDLQVIMQIVWQQHPRRRLQ